MKTAFIASNSRQAGSDVVKSADRILDLLELLGCASGALSLAEVSQALAIPKSSALGLLRTLAARGYAERDEADGYRLAEPFGAEPGDWIGGMKRRVAMVARPVIEALVEQTGETVNLGAMVPGFMVRPLVQVASPQEVRYEPRQVQCPAYCTAMGRVLLAHSNAETVSACLAAPLARLTPATETDPAAIRRLIEQARAQGYAEIDGEFAVGGSGVAAPVFDGAGRVVAALNLASLTERWQRQRRGWIVAVTEAAAEISQRLGHGRGNAA